MLHGQAGQVAASLAAQAGEHKLAGSQRTGVNACVRYLMNKQEYLHYDLALAAGWPIATGVVETAHAYCGWKQQRF